MKIVMKHISLLQEYENNPRDNDSAVDAVAASINEFGFKVPIVITSDNIIIAGHTRLKASIKLGLSEVPCIIANDLTDEQIKAFRLADNKTAELATWDLSKLEEELFDIDMDMLQFGFEELHSDIPDNATDDDFDPDAEIPEVLVSQKGDLYVLGNHRVLCGDSTIKEDVDVLVNEKLVDMIFTDPPYNVDYEGTAGKIQNDKMDDSAFYTFLLSAFTNMFENTKKGGAIYVCHADTEGLNFRNAYKNAGYKLAECLIWVKNALVLGRQDYHWRHEPILYGWKEGAAHYFVDAGLADRCEVGVAYAIGVSEPVSLYIDTFGTGKLSDDDLLYLLKVYFDFTPSNIRKELELDKVKFSSLSAFGHVGRTDLDVVWEKSNEKADVLRSSYEKTKRTT